MDIGTSSSQKTPLRSSDAFVWFFITRIMNDQGDRANRSWTWLQADWSPFKNVAHKRNWQRKLSSAETQGELALYKFITDQLIEQAPELFDSFRNFKPTSSEVSWACFEGYVEGFCDKAAGHPSCIVLDYCLSQSERPMDLVEAVLWMLIAYQEFTLVTSGNCIGSGNQRNIPAISLDYFEWIPVSSCKGLTSSRYLTVNKLISRPEFKSEEESCKRILREQRGPEYWNFGDKIPSALSVNSVYSGLILEKIGVPVDAKKSQIEAFQEHFCGLLHFTGFIGFVQFKLLQSGVEPEEIVNRFEKISLIKADFYKQLLAYSKSH